MRCARPGYAAEDASVESVELRPPWAASKFWLPASTFVAGSTIGEESAAARNSDDGAKYSRIADEAYVASVDTSGEALAARHASSALGRWPRIAVLGLTAISI